MPSKRPLVTPHIGVYIACAGEQEKLKIAQTPEVFAELPLAELRRWFGQAEACDKKEGDKPSDEVGYTRQELG